MRYTVYPGLVSCPFYAIPIYPFKFMKFFIYLYIVRLCSFSSSSPQTHTQYSRLTYVLCLVVFPLSTRTHSGTSRRRFCLPGTWSLIESRYTWMAECCRRRPSISRDHRFVCNMQQLKCTGRLSEVCIVLLACRVSPKWGKGGIPPF